MAKYDATFWRRVLTHAETGGLMGTLKRMVENQEQKVTVALVDNLAEHEILEGLLEESKPGGLFHKRLQRLDYLLRTPWRYPPLKWGSRFGRRFEPSLFYGALSDAALFAEAAYYRLVFLEGMEKPFSDRVISQFTVFEANYQTDKGMDLTRAPFTRHEKVLRHKSKYLPCQELGTELRERGIEAITYLSARADGDEVNVALFSPVALRSRKHRNPRHGLCETRTDGVSFRLGDELHLLPRKAFLDKGRFPIPA
ncbi:MAG: RES family NAD+ phosphorylase [Gammaproteobacteria bacterium]|nr:RES family NAD+ phosphorylase [Gammaproteobacteria bacterium]